MRIGASAVAADDTGPASGATTVAPLCKRWVFGNLFISDPGAYTCRGARTRGQVAEVKVAEQAL